jgi:hypothetical protein
VDPKVRAALAMIESLTRNPDAFGLADIEAARAAGLTDDAIEDATHVCVLFNTYVRLADTLEFDIPSEEGFAAGARILLTAGYRFPPPVVWLSRREPR